VLVGTAVFFALLSFSAEMLWFSALGHSNRFWTAIFVWLGTSLVGGLIGGGMVFGLTWPIPRDPPVSRYWPEALGVFYGLTWGGTHWETILKFWHRAESGVTEPIFGLDASFYLFSLPFYDALYWLLFNAAGIALIASVVYLLAPRTADQDRWERRYRDFRPIYIQLGVLAFLFAWGHYLNRFHLMYSPLGAVSGPGWTDVMVRIPAYWVVMVSCLLLGILLVIPALHRKLHQRKLNGLEMVPGATALTLPVAAVLVVWFLALAVAPALVQWLVVEPNEVSREKPYIEHNIEFTRKGFQLDKAEHREFPASESFTRETVEQNRDVLSQVRLWDPRALVEVYKQFQEIRLYYEFPDVDIDRYTIDGDYRQIMISPREMQLENLPEQGQTFVNRHFKYTHGYGLTMAPVNEFTSQGLPNLLVRDLPPKSKYESLRVDRPQIYYGMLTDTYVVANSKEQEFDYPKGDKNAYISYDGQGGVELKNLWRKFVFGWELGGTRFFFSGYPKSDSRIMFRRHIRKRVQELAPFLHFDEDPYIVLSEGKLYWIIDAYTTSSYYPYSEPYFGSKANGTQDAMPRQTFVPGYLFGKNYIRNSVKTVVDAYDGSVDFYVFEPDDPIIQVWQRIFPDLFQDREAMPDELQAHIRYPEDFLLTQGMVYTKYHMTDPMVFYNQEDLWVRATEKYYGNVQPVEPYYVMWEPPKSDETQFALILPFTPKKRPVMIGWIAGMCDPPNYGRLLTYRFPKEKRILGPQQVESKIDQDSYLSGQLTLWDQRGSNVIRGNVLAIPIGDTLLYVEPIYLQADEAAYPELRLVALMHGDQLSYAETFDEALEGLFEEESRERPEPDEKMEGSVENLIQEANASFNRYLEATSRKQFDEAGKALEALSRKLNALEERFSEQEQSPRKTESESVKAQP
jgi:hypothetical protein